MGTLKRTDASQKFCRGLAKRVAPLMPAVEHEHLGIGQELQVFLELFVRVPVVASPAADQHRRIDRSNVWRDIGRENDDAGGFGEIGGGAVGHRPTLGKAEKD